MVNFNLFGFTNYDTVATLANRQTMYHFTLLATPLTSKIQLLNYYV